MAAIPKRAIQFLRDMPVSGRNRGEVAEFDLDIAQGYVTRGYARFAQAGPLPEYRPKRIFHGAQSKS